MERLQIAPCRLAHPRPKGLMSVHLAKTMDRLPGSDNCASFPGGGMNDGVALA